MGDGEAAPGEFVDRVAEPELQIVVLGEFSERLGEKHQSLAIKAQPGEQRLVEDENRRQEQQDSSHHVAYPSAPWKLPLNFHLILLRQQELDL